MVEEDIFLTEQVKSIQKTRFDFRRILLVREGKVFTHIHHVYSLSVLDSATRKIPLILNGTLKPNFRQKVIRDE